MAGRAKLSDAISMAIHMEEQGIEFYTKCAERVKNPLGKKMFLSLVADEKRHKRIFQDMAEGDHVRPADFAAIEKGGPATRMASVFRDAARRVKKTVKADMDDVKAIDLAKGMEEKAFAFYSETARATKDAEEKRLLQKIALEENEHYRILDDTRLYLTYPEMWFIKEEKPVIDGG